MPRKRALLRRARPSTTELIAHKVEKCHHQPKKFDNTRLKLDKYFHHKIFGIHFRYLWLAICSFHQVIWKCISLHQYTNLLTSHFHAILQNLLMYYPYVMSKIGHNIKSPFANVTAEWFFLTVNKHVMLQLALGGKCFCAFMAPERFYLEHGIVG